MNSPFTGKKMKLKKETKVVSFRKQEVEYTNLSYFCEDSKEYFVTTELDELNIRQIHNKYRELNNIPFPDEIKGLRQKYGLSAIKMGELFGFGPNQYALYENGEIPSISNAKAISLALEPVVFKKMIEDNRAVIKDRDYKSIITKIDHKLFSEIGLDIEKYLLGNKIPNSFTGYKSPDYNKLVNMVVYFVEKLRPQKSVLNKLLFYSDFSHYKNFAESISGCRYAAISHNPVPEKFRSIFEKIEDDNLVSIIYKEFPDGKIEEQFVPVPKSNSDTNLFSEEEINTLNTVCSFFKGKTAKRVAEISHEKTMWLDEKANNSLINYNEAFDLELF